MKVGDLVIRKINKNWSLSDKVAYEQRAELGYGIILSKQPGGSHPIHPCITVLYPKTGQVYDIAESLMEVTSEDR